MEAFAFLVLGFLLISAAMYIIELRKRLADHKEELEYWRRMASFRQSSSFRYPNNDVEISVKTH